MHDDAVKAPKAYAVDAIVALGKNTEGELVVFMSSGRTWKQDTSTGIWIPALPAIPGTAFYLELQADAKPTLTLEPKSLPEGGELAVQVPSPPANVDPKAEHARILEEIKGLGQEIKSMDGGDGAGYMAKLHFLKGREIDLLPWTQSNWVMVKKNPTLAREIEQALRLVIAAAPILD